jgi:eukaryotic-like serine/threonine-protein kinase
MDRSGKELMAVGEPGGITDFVLSPDEKRIVIARPNETANARAAQDLWMYDSEHQTASRFTTTATNSRPVWSPDGTKVAFSSNRAGRTDLYEKPATGAVAERSIYATKDSPKFGSATLSRPTASAFWCLRTAAMQLPPPSRC